jgi:putative glutamine amidotransferase
MKHYLLITIFFQYVFLFGQSIRLATIRDNENVKTFMKNIDSSVVVVNFSKIEKRKWKQELKKCHGIILSGGADIHPKRYGKSDYVELCQLEEKRDEQEWRLLTLAKEDSIPIFGICRGMQFINVFFGGTLCPDFLTHCARQDDSAQMHRDSNQKVDVYHSIYINTESLLNALLQKETMIVNSWHHQSIELLAESFLVSSIADDGTIESIESTNQNWPIIGVQWHPERMNKNDESNTLLMRYFLHQCKKRMPRKSIF